MTNIESKSILGLYNETLALIEKMCSKGLGLE